MDQSLNIFQIASQLSAHATERQAIIAQNTANADTPGYKARDLTPFAESFDAGAGMALRATRAGHLSPSLGMAPSVAIIDSPFGAESPNGNSVSIEDQMVRAAEVRHQHDLAVGIYQKSLQILRTSMGRK